MRKAYTAAQQAEAVALAHVMGYEPAAKQLGIDPRTVLKWMRKAGKAPLLDAPSGGWTPIMELAQAKVASAVASGKLTAVQIATIGGIAARNASRETRPEAGKRDEAATEAYLRDRYGLHHVIVLRIAQRMDMEPMALADQLKDWSDDEPVLEQAAVEALQEYHRDHGCDPHSGGTNRYRDPCPEPLADPWTWLLELGGPDGTLFDWLEAREAERRVRDEQASAERERNAATWKAGGIPDWFLEKNPGWLDRFPRRSQPADPETERLIALAEAWLGEGAADVA